MQISKSKHVTMGLVVYGCVFISASLSAQYGYMSAGESASVYEKYVMAATFAMFDLIVVLLAGEAASKWLTRAAAKMLVVVLFSLSCISGAAYMIGQQSKEQSSQVTMLKRQIDMLDNNIGRLDPNTRPGTLRNMRAQRDEAYRNLQGVYSKSGGEVTSSNAFYIYMGKFLGVSPDALASLAKILTMVSLNLSGIVLSAIRSQNSSYNSVPARKQQAVLQHVLPAEETNRSTLEEIKKSILSGRIKPSVTAVAQSFCKNNRAMADHYLSLLEKAGIVRSQGHGKKRLVIA
jgi:hypothetical protein